MIDPTLSYSTFLGGRGEDLSYAITVDASNNIYVIGETNSPNFPTPAAHDPTFDDSEPYACGLPADQMPYCSDVFVTKYDPTLSRVIYSTYVGGKYQDAGRDVAADPFGNLYVAGITESPDFPLLNNAFAPAPEWYQKSFVLKLDGAGRLVYSTFVNSNFSCPIATDATGALYIGRNTYVGNSDAGESIIAAYVTKLNAGGSSELYSTLLGSGGGMFVSDIAVDALGNAYAAGGASGGELTAVNPLQPSGGDRDAFITKLNGAGAVAFSTYLGGAGEDAAASVAVDAGGNIYAAGKTASLDFPTTASAFERTLSGTVWAADAFVTKLNASGTAVLYSTYLGGSAPKQSFSHDAAHKVVVNSAGHAYVVGNAESSDFPITADAWSAAGGMFLAQLDTNASGAASLMFSTYYGGYCAVPNGACPRGLRNTDIAIDAAGDIAITGSSLNPLSPLPPFSANGAQREHRGGYSDAYIAKFTFGQKPPSPEPLIFVPGIAGSHLVAPAASDYGDPYASGELWLGFLRDHNLLTLDPREKQLDVIATDVLRKTTVPPTETYNRLLNMLTGEGGFTEYDVGGKPERRTEAGCDYEAQRDKKPNLFVFAYDWRKSNEENARKMGEYVKCVRKFHPDKEVNILAHSMGGLLSRRYILQQPGDHNVKRLITINTPWLGAPKAIDVLETGAFPPATPVLIWSSTLKRLAEFFPGMHQLLPSRHYYRTSLYYDHLPATIPLTEHGWDIDGDGVAYENYDYDQQVRLLDTLHPHEQSKPGTAGKNFHDTSGQDDWQGDMSGVEYHSIISTQNRDNTIGEVRAWREANCFGDTTDSGGLYLRCGAANELRTVMTQGDETVPLVSLERGWSYNLQLRGESTLHFFHSPDPSVDTQYNHTKATEVSAVHDRILYLLGLKAAPPEGIPEIYPEVYPQDASRIGPNQKSAALTKASFRERASDAQPKALPSTAPNLSPSELNKRPSQSELETEHDFSGADYQVGARRVDLRSAHRRHHSFFDRPEVTLPRAWSRRLESIAGSRSISDIRGHRSHAWGYLGAAHRTGYQQQAPLAYEREGSNALGNEGNSRGFSRGSNLIYHNSGHDRSEDSDVRVQWISDRREGISIQTVLDLGGNRSSDRWNCRGGGGADNSQSPVLLKAAFTRDGEESSRADSSAAPRASNEGGVSWSGSAPLAVTQQSGGRAYGTPRPPTQPSYYVTVKGVGYISVTDAAGNTNEIIDDTFMRRVPNVSYDRLGEKSILISTPTNQTYTMTFQVGDSPIMVEIIKGVNNVEPTQIVRYRDKVLPAGVTAMLKVTAEGVEDLRYDTDGDGVFEVVVAPTVSAEGDAARDVTPPTLHISSTPQQAHASVIISAQDGGAGVRAVYYSLDGTNYRRYDAPFVVDPTQTPLVHAFADDNLANRSSLATYRVPVAVTTAAVRPVLECVAANGDGTYTARFGYKNDNTAAVTVPVGGDNRFSPLPQARGQVTAFQPGRVRNAFEVVFDGSNLVWTLKGPDGARRTATASRNSARCQ